MDRALAKSLIKPQLKNHLQNKGIKTSKLFRCLSRNHEDKNPSMSYDIKREKVRCFSCGVDWDIFDVIGDEYGLTDNRDIFDKAYEIFNIDISSSASQPKMTYQFDDIDSKLQPLNDNNPNDQTEVEATRENLELFFLQAQANLVNPDCIAYLSKRGISEETAKRYGVGYISNWQSPKLLREGKNPPPTPRIIIPTSQGSYTTRDIMPDSRNRYMKEGKANIFNIDALAGEEPCFVVEGEFDALSFLEIGFNAVALGSTSNIESFLEKLKTLSRCSPLIVATDADKSGKDAAKKLEEGLKKLRIKYTVCNLYKGTNFNDPNDLLVADKVNFKETVRELVINFSDQLSDDAHGEVEEVILEVVEAEEKFEIEKREFLQRRGTAHRVEALREKRKINEDKKLIPTGFTQLDKKLGGGLYDAFYVIGASPGAGKTTFAIQMADHIASEGGDVLYISLEVSELEIAARSISRRTAEYCDSIKEAPELAKNTMQILIGANCNGFSTKECEIIYNAEENYKKYGGNFIIHEGGDETKIDTIKTAIKEYQEYTGNVPVVIVDYLQILDPDNDKMNEKQNMDNAAKKLKHISRDFKTPVIAISSVNRESYNNPKAGMEALKESGRIESSCDVLILLKPQGAAGDSVDTNSTQGEEQRGIVLEILKNRNGEKGGSIKFNYYPRINTFAELEAAKKTK